MFCRNCGNNIPDDSSFCTVCGSALNYGAPSPVPTAPATEKTAKIPNDVSAKKMRTTSIISIVLVSGIIGLSAFMYFKYFDPKKEGEKLPDMFWLFAGILIVLAVALVINIVIGKKKRCSTDKKITATYSLPVNPTISQPSTFEADTHGDFRERNDNYDLAASDNSINSESLNPENVFATQYAEEQKLKIEQIYNNSDDVKTKYAPTYAMPKKDVEIIFSAENTIPNVNSEMYVFSPGISDFEKETSELPCMAEHVNPTPTEFKAPAESVVLNPVAESASIPETPAVSDDPVVSETDAAQPVKKPSADSFFKSAGDL